MKWVSMTLTVLALIFVFGATDVQAQPGGPGGGGGCTDSTGAPIPCPPDEPTDENVNPCEDTDEDGVCDADEPPQCVGQVNEDGEGCETIPAVTLTEILIAMVESVEPEIPRDKDHKGWSDLMSLGNVALEMGLFSFNFCDEDFHELLMQATRGDADAIQRLNELIQECAGGSSVTRAEIKDSGNYTTWIPSTGNNVFMLCVASSTEETAACDIVSTRAVGGVRVAAGDVNGIVILDEEPPLVFASSTPSSSDGGQFDFDWFRFTAGTAGTISEIEQTLRDDLEAFGEYEDEARQALEQLENWIGEVQECDLSARSGNGGSAGFFSGSGGAGGTAVQGAYDLVQEECPDDGEIPTGAPVVIWLQGGPGGSSSFDPIYLILFRVPESEAIIAILIGLGATEESEGSDDAEPRAKKIYIGDINVNAKPDRKTQGEAED